MKFLTTMFYWINCIGAILTSIGVLIANHHGFWGSFPIFLLLFISFKLGVSPLFMAASSLLYFYFEAAGLWLPLTSYVASIGSLLVAYMLMRSINVEINP